MHGGPVGTSLNLVDHRSSRLIVVERSSTWLHHGRNNMLECHGAFNSRLFSKSTPSDYIAGLSRRDGSLLAHPWWSYQIGRAFRWPRIEFHNGLELLVCSPYMATPPSDAHYHHVNRYNWTIILPAELSAAAILINYWNQSVNNSAWITICLVVVVTINMFGAGVYGEAEFIFAYVLFLLHSSTSKNFLVQSKLSRSRVL